MLGAEALFRVKAWQDDRGTLENLQNRQEIEAAPREDGHTLGAIIRMSRHPAVVYELMPNLRTRHIGNPLSTNSHGFRGPEVPLEKPDSTFRIVGIGDSLMFGHGTADDTLYLHLLAEGLRERLPDRRLDYVNTAVSGYNTAMEVAVLRERGLAFDPDLVLIHWVGNDFELPLFIRTRENYLRLDRSFLVTYLRQRFLAQYRMTAGRLEYATREDHETIPEAYRFLSGKEPNVAALDDLADLAVRHGFSVIFFSIEEPHPEVMARVRRHGFAYINGWSAIREAMTERGVTDYYDSEFTVAPGDPHPSELTHRIMADTLIEAFLAKDLVTPARLPSETPPRE